jgi:hypothetical protein
MILHEFLGEPVLNVGTASVTARQEEVALV